LVQFAFALDWQWVETRLSVIWKPFLLGCLVCGVLAGVLGYLLLAVLWRVRVIKRYQKRPARLRGARGVINQNPPL
jgi:uncharacterized protein (DUF2062 family)